MPPSPPPSGDTCIAVLMSGGVDSSVAAWLLQQAGWNVLGVTMHLPQVPCADPTRSAVARAKAVCQHLRIEHQTIDLGEAFEEAVVEPFRQAYRIGRTPNPCVLCNPAIKFGRLREGIAELGGPTQVATGHYARILHDTPSATLARGRNRRKDQSYFLYRLPPEILETIVFPLGELASKDQTRDMAAKASLPIASTGESMEICFVPDDDYRAFLGDHASHPGPIRLRTGEIVGEHSGISNYTRGQRRGLGKGFGQPMYVLQILPAENAIVIGPREEAYVQEVHAAKVNVLIPEEWQTGTVLGGKTRSAGDPRPCEILHADGETLTVRFAEPVFAPTPGQHLVLFDTSERVVGGAEIVAGPGAP